MAIPFRYNLSDAQKDALLNEQAALIVAQAARIAELEGGLRGGGKPRKTSSNSHTPPSQDGLGKANKKNDMKRAAATALMAWCVPRADGDA